LLVFSYLFYPFFGSFFLFFFSVGSELAVIRCNLTYETGSDVAECCAGVVKLAWTLSVVGRCGVFRWCGEVGMDAFGDWESVVGRCGVFRWCGEVGMDVFGDWESVVGRCGVFRWCGEVGMDAFGG